MGSRNRPKLFLSRWNSLWEGDAVQMEVVLTQVKQLIQLKRPTEGHLFERQNAQVCYSPFLTNYSQGSRHSHVDKVELSFRQLFMWLFAINFRNFVIKVAFFNRKHTIFPYNAIRCHRSLAARRLTTYLRKRALMKWPGGWGRRGSELCKTISTRVRLGRGLAEPYWICLDLTPTTWKDN